MTTRIPALKGFGSGAEGTLANRQRRSLNLSWGYGWSADYPGYGFSPQGDGNPQGFVPMIWGPGSFNRDALNLIKKQLPKTKATNLLGFNEPDLIGQSNMTVEQAVELWPLLESTGLRLGAPATIGPTRQWLIDFMAAADAANLRIDFMPVHIYMNPEAEDFLDKLETAYATYGLPIWVTEYAVADFDATTKEENRYSTTQVERFMRKTVAGMRRLPFVERFAWKTRNVNDPQMWSSALFQENGTLTSRGRLYASL